MNRRGFFGLLGGAVAGIALEQAIPFGRVWSFPSEIIVPDINMLPGHIALRYLHANLNFIGTINKQYDNQFASLRCHGLTMRSLEQP